MDLTKLSEVELLKLEVAQQEQLLALFSQIQQVQNNITALKAELAKRETNVPSVDEKHEPEKVA